MLFSVIVPTHNGGELLRSCLRSISALNFPKDQFEVIIVDNKSTDNSVTIIDEFPFKKVLELDNKSLYAARNAGLAVSRGEIIAFTNADCEVDPEWLNHLADAARRNPKAGCIAGEILAFPPESTVERYSESIGLLRQKGPLSGWHFKPYAQTANAAFRRTVFDAIGGFDADLKSGGDATIAWRMLDNTDFELVFEPDAVVYHHHRTDVTALWSQFKRYGGGKISWAQKQRDYVPPRIAEHENDLIQAMEAYFEKAELAGLDEQEQIYPLLSLVTKAAHLSGYFQELLRNISGVSDSDQWPVLAARTGSDGHLNAGAVSACTICGGTKFGPGPNGRLAQGLKPRCEGCGALERHRAANVLQRLIADGLSLKRQLHIGRLIPALATPGGKHIRQLDPQLKDIFDFIIVLDHERTSTTSFQQELSYYTDRLSTTGLLALSVADSPLKPTSRRDGEGVLRLGADAAWRVSRALPEQCVLSARLRDPCTGCWHNFAISSRAEDSLVSLAQKIESDGGCAVFVTR